MVTYRRHPEVKWRLERRSDAEARELLEESGDVEEAAALGTLTLVAGGQVAQLNVLGAEIWQLLEAELDEEQIVAALVETFDASAETIASDVEAFLAELAKEGWIEIVR